MVCVMTISAKLLMNGLYPVGVLIIELPLLSGLISGFTPAVIWFIPQWRLPSVCTAMSVRLPSYLSSLVSFTCYIESSKSYIHTFIYSCTPTFIHTHIHAYKHSCTYNCIQKSFIHNCINYSESWFNKTPKKCHPYLCLIQRGHQSNLFSSVSFYKQYTNTFHLL